MCPVVYTSKFMIMLPHLYLECVFLLESERRHGVTLDSERDAAEETTCTPISK